MPFRWPAPLARQADNVLIRRSFAWRHSVTREKVERFTFAGAAHRPRRRDSAAGIRAS